MKSKAWCLKTSQRLVSLNFQSDRLRPVKGKHVYFALAGGFPGGSDDKESACYVRDPGLLPGLGRSPGVGNGNPLQYYCLEDLTDRGVWWAIVHRLARVGNN